MKSARLILIAFTTLMIGGCAALSPEGIAKRSNSSLCMGYFASTFNTAGIKVVQDELARRGVVPIEDQAIMDDRKESRVPDGASESTLLCKFANQNHDKFAVEHLDSDPMINKPGIRSYKRSLCKVGGACAEVNYVVVNGKIASSLAK